jgi:flagellin
MRINHNISALNTRRHLVTNTQAQAKNLERLSSGLKINRGADGPAQLIISERLRTQQASLKQAIDNNEAGVTVLQTAEGALSEANRSLIHIRELAVHAANEAVNDEFMLQADQQEIDHVLAQVDRIARTANYGKKALLDGSMGANGVTTGANLEFISATEFYRSGKFETKSKETTAI